MKKITVYADFDFLASPQEIGTLGYERVRGKDHFVFEYSHEWLKQHGGIVLSGDLMNVPSLQHPRSTDSVFGFVKDSFPDRWGRLLLDRRERLKAQAEGSPPSHRPDWHAPHNPRHTWRHRRRPALLPRTPLPQHLRRRPQLPRSPRVPPHPEHGKSDDDGRKHLPHHR